MNFSKLDKYMESMPERGIPATELAVTQNGKLIYRKMVGFSDAQKTKPVSNKDIYWIFSCSKVITCALAMRLVEEGKIGLDDAVSKYLPEYGDVFVRRKDRSISRADNEMKIWHLFTMTSGLNYDFSLKHVQDAIAQSNGVTRDVVASFVKSPLDFEPGTHYKYGLSHDVLAAIIEVVSGMTFAEYAEKYLSEPLGLCDFGIHPDEEQKSRFSTMYMYDRGIAASEKIDCSNFCALGEKYESGGAGFFSTVDDYMKIITVMANGGSTSDGYRFLKPETIEMMKKNYLCHDALNDFINTRLYGYGWGLCGRVHMNPTVSGSLSPIGEFGWDSAAAAFSMVDTENKIALYFGTHVRGCNYSYHQLHPAIRNLVYEGLDLE